MSNHNDKLHCSSVLELHRIILLVYLSREIPKCQSGEVPIQKSCTVTRHQKTTATENIVQAHSLIPYRIAIPVWLPSSTRRKHRASSRMLAEPRNKTASHCLDLLKIGACRTQSPRTQAPIRLQETVTSETDVSADRKDLIAKEHPKLRRCAQDLHHSIP